VWRRFRLPRFGAVDGAFEGAEELKNRSARTSKVSRASRVKAKAI